MLHEPATLKRSIHVLLAEAWDRGGDALSLIVVLRTSFPELGDYIADVVAAHVIRRNVAALRKDGS